MYTFFLSFSDMRAVSSACNVRHLCSGHRTVSTTNFTVSSVRVSLSRGIQVSSMVNTIFTSQVCFSCLGKMGVCSNVPLIKRTRSVLPKVTPSYLHRKQLSADRAADTALKEALCRTSVARTLTPSAVGVKLKPPAAHSRTFSTSAGTRHTFFWYEVSMTT